MIDQIDLDKTIVVQPPCVAKHTGQPRLSRLELPSTPPSKPQTITTRMYTRREFIAVAGGATLNVLSGGCRTDSHRSPLSLGFSLYGMKSLAIERALLECARIGYDNVELSLISGFPTEPQRLTPNMRAAIRRQATAANLRISSLLASLSLDTDDTTRRSHLEDLRTAANFAREIDAAHPPVIQTTMGGRPENWDALKDLMARRLQEWDGIAREYHVTIAVKAHVAGAVNTPDRLLWILREAKGSNLAIAYDHSHFQFSGLSFHESLPPLVAQTRFVHLKDGIGTSKDFRFLLPGDGSTDFRGLCKMLIDSGYRGAVVAEVSRQIFDRPDYDPVAAAEKCYAALAPSLT